MPRTVNCTNLGISHEQLTSIIDNSHPDSIHGNKISWGEPAKVCQARIDRACPVCGAMAGEVQYSGTQLISGFESDGKDGMCGGCGFTFTTDCCQVGKAAEHPKAGKPRCKQGKKAARARDGKGVRGKTKQLKARSRAKTVFYHLSSRKV